MDTNSVEPAPEVAASLAAAPDEVDSSQEGLGREYVLGIISTSHLLNHMQGGIRAVLLPLMMQAVGFDILQLGLLTAFYQLAATGMQAIYGVLAQYFRRSSLLGIANIVLGAFSGVTGLAGNYAQVMGAQVLSAFGSSAQHPLGSAMITSHFKKARGRAQGIQHTAANAGNLIAPLIVVGLLRFLDWRAIWIVLAIPSILMGFAYFFVKEKRSGGEVSKKAKTRVALQSYLACLKNRDAMAVSLIQMTGAAGRGTDINQAYFVPFFMAFLSINGEKISLEMAGLLLAVLQAGSVLGPACIGWLSDRISRRWAVFAVLTMSCVSTVTLLAHSEITIALILNLVVYGLVVNSRESLTVSLLGDSVPEEHYDAAFSLYYFIGFISGPAWTALTGYLVASRGFAVAWWVVGLTYLTGIVLIGLLSSGKKARVTTA